MFQKVWDKDSSATKSKAMQDFKYIYFVGHRKSPYHKNTDMLEIPERVKNEVLLDSSYKPSKDVERALEYLRTAQTTKSAALLDAGDNIIAQMKTVLSEVSPEELKSDFKNISSMLKELPTIVKNYEAARKLVEQELDEKAMMDKTGKELGSRELPKKREW